MIMSRRPHPSFPFGEKGGSFNNPLPNHNVDVDADDNEDWQDGSGRTRAANPLHRGAKAYANTVVGGQGNANEPRRSADANASGDYKLSPFAAGYGNFLPNFRLPAVEEDHIHGSRGDASSASLPPNLNPISSSYQQQHQYQTERAQMGSFGADYSTTRGPRPYSVTSQQDVFGSGGNTAVGSTTDSTVVAPSSSGVIAATETAGRKPVPPFAAPNVSLEPSELGHPQMMQVVSAVDVSSSRNLLADGDDILGCLRPLMEVQGAGTSKDSKRRKSEGDITPLTLDTNKRRRWSERTVNESQKMMMMMVAARSADMELSPGGMGTNTTVSAATKSSPRLSFFEEGDEGEESSSISSSQGNKEIDLKEYQTALWERRYRELCEYNERQGHCLVPHNWAENLALAKWVKRQRYQYKLKSLGKHSTLTEDRREALDRLGFVWDSHQAAWEEKLADLIAFQKAHGHCLVPSKYKENHSLSIWVQCQRRKYKLFCEGKQTSMTIGRITKLNDLGFVWKPASSGSKGDL